MPIKHVEVESVLEEEFTMFSRIGEHTVCVDQPKVFGGDDKGPSPVEYILFALAGCIGAVARIIANQKKIPLRSVSVKLQGDLELDALLGKSTECRPGFAGIDVSVVIDADMTTEEKRAFLEEIETRCPISDNLANPTPVVLRLEE